LPGLICASHWSKVAGVESGPLRNIAIILVNTKYSGNVGGAARAMHNMGLNELRLVAPQCDLDEEAFRRARGGKGILEGARNHRALRSALRGFSLCVGTTGKRGGNRARAMSPRAMAPDILRCAARQKVGIVFGPEDTGLVDEDLMLCQQLVRIPTRPDASSINLAQAVMVLCYELHCAGHGRETPRSFKRAPIQQIEAMYGQLQEALLAIGFLHPKNARHMMFTLRRLLGRAGLEPEDVGTLRGIARQIRWYSLQPERSTHGGSTDPLDRGKRP